MLFNPADSCIHASSQMSEVSHHGTREELLGYGQQAGPEGRLPFGRGVALLPLFSMLLSGLLAQAILWFTHPPLLSVCCWEIPGHFANVPSNLIPSQPLFLISGHPSLSYP